MKADATTLADQVIAGDRRALARAITVVESDRADHRADALRLIEAAQASGRQALRIGLSGTPGVGKSTFIEAFGMHLIDLGLRVAVLAVDPSSARTGGSILGDKTRMDRLVRQPGAFIRPSPSRSTLGGVARRTREAILLVEAAGYDVVLIETVGVGQSETMVAGMSDIFTLLIGPGGGDELQGVKRGIMEIADIVLVNKADGALKPVAERTRADYAAALRLMRRAGDGPDGLPCVMTTSALENTGVSAAWAQMQALADWRRGRGVWDRTRAEQARLWFEEDLRAGLLARLTADPDLATQMAALGDQVQAGRTAPSAAAAALLNHLAAGEKNA